MGDGYTKLFSDIVDSSIWDEDKDTRIVWITLLALSNADGFVRGSVGWLSGKARVPVKACAIALKKFASPDPHSRTPDNDGRRIEVLDDGWLILNYLIFRDRLSSSPKAVKTRERVRKHRERHQALRNANSVTSTHSASASESVPGTKGVQGDQPPLFEVPSKKFQKPDMASMELYAAKIGLPVTEINKFFDYYESNGWRVGRNPMKSWEAAMRNWKNHLQTYGTKTTGTNRPEVNKRNQGVIDNGTDYAAAGKAKLARQHSTVVRQVDSAQIAPSLDTAPGA